jgi:hypothetical protein
MDTDVGKEVHKRFRELYGNEDILLFVDSEFDNFKEIVTNPKYEEIEEEFNYRERRKEEHDRFYQEFNQGMELFKEYFFSLWW